MSRRDSLPLRRIDHVRFFVGNARQSAYFYRNAFGFDVVGYGGLETRQRHEAGYVLRQGKITFVLISPLSGKHPESGRLITHGDGVADIDITALVQFHQSHGRLATVTVVRPPSRYGILELTDDQRVGSFAEKPLLPGWASAGFFVFNRRVFDYLDGDGCVLEREPLERLTAEGQLMAYRHEGFFFAMDTYREYQVLNDLWESGRAPWKVWDKSSRQWAVGERSAA